MPKQFCSDSGVDSRSVSTPGTGKPLDLKLGILLDDGNKQLYQEIVGNLSTCTRWDIAYSVVQLTRTMSNPKDEHMVAVKRVLRYLKGTPNLCVRYSKVSEYPLRGHHMFILRIAHRPSWLHYGVGNVPACIRR